MMMLVGGCSTRTPETPTSFGGEFIPPVSADIVLDNFIAAVNNVNTENYMLCLADATLRSPQPFRFEPSAEARARYQALYDTWSTVKERQSFLAMRSRIRDNRPLLSLFNRTETFSSPDLKIFSMDYELMQLGSGGDYDPDDALVDFMMSDSKFNGPIRPDTMPFGYFADPEVDELTELQRVESDIEKRKELVQKANLITSNKVAFAFTHHPVDNLIYRAEVNFPDESRIPGLVDMDRITLG